ncbi:MAG: hypothetical protein RIQ52_30 [Pseudomonadota bacterium]
MAGGWAKVANYSVKQKFMAVILGGLLLVLLTSLGFWQLRRADEKQRIAELWEARKVAQPLDNAGLLASQPAWQDTRYQPVLLSGILDEAHGFLLDNQVHAGRVGYHVLVPLQLEGSDVHVIVNRGWVPAPGDRSRLPQVPLSGGVPISIRGQIAPFFRVGLRLKGDDTPGDGWPSRVQVVEASALALKLGYPVLPVQILEAGGGATEGYVRDWQPGTSGAEKSRAYAVQWFSLAAMTLALLIWYGFVKKSGSGTGRDSKY